MARDHARYKVCQHCSFVGNTKDMLTHNDMGCLRSEMNRQIMSECSQFRPHPKSPEPDRKF